MLEYLSDVENVVEAMEYAKNRYLKEGSKVLPPLLSPKEEDNLVPEVIPDVEKRQNFNSPMHKSSGESGSFVFKNDPERDESDEEENQ